MITGAHKAAVKTLLWGHVGWLALRTYRNPRHAVSALRALTALRQRVRDGRTTPRYAFARGRYSWDLYSPGWPSLAFDRHVESELLRYGPGRNRGGSGNGGSGHGGDNGGSGSGNTGDGSAASESERLQTLIFAITKKCPLRCEHCCEWKVLNQPESLTSDALHRVVERFQELGVSQIQFSGGEPLQRFDDLVEVLQRARAGTDFWILSSGVGLTPERARRLADAGLTGVSLSLDHHDGARHSAFRGLAGSDAWVERAAVATREAGMLLCLTLCPTRDFVSAENLEKYAERASQLGASFIQLLEPRPVGHYEGKSVALQPDHIEVLESFFRRMNSAAAANDAPLVMYPAYTQRRHGCFGAGHRYLYVDTDGLVHRCPFCRDPMAHALHDDLRELLSRLRRSGCAAFRTASLGTERIAEDATSRPAPSPVSPEAVQT